MLTIQPSCGLLENIEHALAGELEYLEQMVPDFKERLLKNLSWGIFSKKPLELGPTEGRGRTCYDEVMCVSHNFIAKAKSLVAESNEFDAPFFAESVERALQSKNLFVTMNYDSLNTLVYSQNVIETEKEPDALIALTLPDCDVMFEHLIKPTENWQEYIKVNGWVSEYQDQYEEWRRKLMEHLYNYTYQIGGHGRWIQYDYNGQYIGQANIEIGDCGSVYVYTNGNSSFDAGVDMF